MSQTKIKPAVGHVVLYHPAPSETNAELIQSAGKGTPVPAIVTAVHSDSCVNLAVFDANGKAHARTSVTMIHPDSVTNMGHSFAVFTPEHIAQHATHHAGHTAPAKVSD